MHRPAIMAGPQALQLSSVTGCSGHNCGKHEDTQEEGDVWTNCCGWQLSCQCTILSYASIINSSIFTAITTVISGFYFASHTAKHAVKGRLGLLAARPPSQLSAISRVAHSSEYVS